MCNKCVPNHRKFRIGECGVREHPHKISKNLARNPELTQLPQLNSLAKDSKANERSTSKLPS